MKRIAMFLLLLLLWFLLVWPFYVADGRVHFITRDVIMGIAAALFVVMMMRNQMLDAFANLINPVRLFWFAVYAVVFAFNVIKANLDVAYRIVHPAMPIRPGIVKVKTTLKTAVGLTMLSNAIALTPGTLTVHVTKDGDLYVHWINVKATDVDEATKQIVSRFEWLIRKIFE
jgi:multicomponent Na+:H+ antiporter subunit E